jgi:H+/Cl- antiporter ClcA
LIFSVTMATAAALLTVFVGPKAAGSGVPELIGCLNGVRIAEWLTPTVLFVKVVGVTLAVAGSLVVGKEGPLAHIGAIIAIIVFFAPIESFNEFRTGSRYREFVAAGISAGVSVAFGAPIGGTLFAYELSNPSTFWTFKNIWRNFFCASIATFSLALLVALQYGTPITLSA